MRLRDLLDKRAQLVVRMREINDKAGAESRALTTEEQTNYDAAFKEADGLRATIDREERLAVMESEVAQRSATLADPEQRTERKKLVVRAIDAAEHRYRVQFGADDTDIVRRFTESRGTGEYAEGWRNYIRTGEKRALSAGSGPDGGYLVTPVQFVQDLLKALDDVVFMRARGTVFTVPTATSLGRVTLDADPSDADWTAELATGNEDSSLKFGKRELTPHPSAKRIKISQKLLRQRGDVDGIAIERLRYKFGITEEKAFLIGDGVQKPLGAYTPSIDGVPTTRDVPTGAGTGFTMDGLIAAKYALKDGYFRNAAWNFHRDGVSKISQLKDSTNNYLWQPSTQLGQPDRLLGAPVITSEYTPNVFTSGLYVGMLADWSYYHIADALDMQLQRLNELYAETNQVGYIARRETDGQPVLAEAFARLKTS